MALGDRRIGLRFAEQPFNLMKSNSRRTNFTCKQRNKTMRRTSHFLIFYLHFHTSRADCAFGIVSFSSGGSVLAGLADSGMYPVRECARRKLAELGLGAGGSLHSSMLTLDGTALYLFDFHSAFTGS